MKTYLAYHKEHEHGPFGGSDFFSNELVEKGANFFVVAATKQTPNGKVNYWLEGKYRVADFGPNRTGRHTERKTHLRLMKLVCPPTRIALDGAPNFDRTLFHNNFTSGSGLREIKSGNQVFSDLFDSLLGAEEDPQAIEFLRDLDEIDSDPTSNDPTERDENRKARVGQGKFRRDTVDTWGGVERCAVTGIDIPALLNASHIIPWSEDVQQRRSGHNGILLAAHLDRLFDRFLIGFRPTSNANVLLLTSAPCLKSKFSLLAAIGITERSSLELTMIRCSDRPKLEANLRSHLDRVVAKT